MKLLIRIHHYDKNHFLEVSREVEVVRVVVVAHKLAVPQLNLQVCEKVVWFSLIVEDITKSS